MYSTMQRLLHGIQRIFYHVSSATVLFAKWQLCHGNARLETGPNVAKLNRASMIHVSSYSSSRCDSWRELNQRNKCTRLRPCPRSTFEGDASIYYTCNWTCVWSVREMCRYRPRLGWICKAAGLPLTRQQMPSYYTSGRRGTSATSRRPGVRTGGQEEGRLRGHGCGGGDTKSRLVTCATCYLKNLPLILVYVFLVRFKENLEMNVHYNESLPTTLCTRNRFVFVVRRGSVFWQPGLSA